MCKTHEDRLLRPETPGTNYPLTQSHISEECRPQNECSLKFGFRGFKVLRHIFLSQNLFYLHSEVAGTKYQFVCPWLCSVAGVQGTQATNVGHID